IASPLLEDVAIDGATGILINVTGGPGMGLHEINAASSLIEEAADEDANIIFGAVIDDTVPDGELRVTVIATGLDDERQRRTPPERPTRRTDAREDDFRPEQIEIEHVARSRPPEPGLEPVPSQAQAGGVAPEAPPHPASAREGVPATRHDELAADAIARADAGFDSPFEEDELDTPAFLRKRDHGEDDDRETPAFLRRAQD
ncbi:MAG: hypothetical protein OEV20_06695, partial [Actinomycetota bacterium]|nr:hypothetical protein [Actinomycetota bacterium]